MLSKILKEKKIKNPLQYIFMKFQNTKYTEKILKAFRVWENGCPQETKIRLPSQLSVITLGSIKKGRMSLRYAEQLF